MTPPHRIPHNLLVAMTSTSHVLMIAGAIALYAAGKIDATAFAAIMAGFGGAWSGVAGVLISTRQKTPSSLPVGATPAPGATATPSPLSATPAAHQ